MDSIVGCPFFVALPTVSANDFDAPIIYLRLIPCVLQVFLAKLCQFIDVFNADDGS